MGNECLHLVTVCYLKPPVEAELCSKIFSLMGGQNNFFMT